ncbi:hypothetical protein ACJMK2_027536 [Sinanodonta woodiana]|uniref:Uncharacterized protein n=1 Tax=Sinanodonta woodiana TaxID=1069815 RepID=A0ABD3XN32_SINWO
MISLKMMNETYKRNVCFINQNEYNRYIIRPNGTKPIQPYGETNNGQHRINMQDSTPILRNIIFKNGDLHITDILTEIPTEDIV